VAGAYAPKIKSEFPFFQPIEIPLVSGPILSVVPQLQIIGLIRVLLPGARALPSFYFAQSIVQLGRPN
jgi:hypothetical protein